MEESVSVSSDENDQSKKSKKMSKLRLEAQKYREDLDHRGVIYLSRIPPHMKPNKAQAIFQDFGEVTRLYLAEEDQAIRKKRKEAGGNASRMFREGWIEFADKKVAKRVAESLNNTIMGGKKGNFYHDDIWNIKYLKNFKWDYLTEKFAYEKRVREKKLSLAMDEERKANAEFAELVEKNNVQKFVESRKRKRAGTPQADEEATSSSTNPLDRSGKDQNSRKRMFRQRQVLSQQHGEGEARIFDREMIDGIFGSKKKK